jgi:hypothetical protein
MFEVSIVPGTDKTEAVREGGVPELWAFPVGLRAGLGGSLARCCAAVNGAVPIFEMIFIRLFGPRVDNQAYERDHIYSLLVDVIHSFTITVVVEIDLNKCLGILAKPGKHSENHRLLLQSRRSHFENGNKNFV